MKNQFLVFLLGCIFMTILAANAQNNIKKYTLEPTPTWIKNYPKPTLQESYDSDLPMVHVETQYNHNTGEEFSRIFYYMKDNTALNSLRSYYLVYEPDHETISIHKAMIHRGKEQLSLGKQLHVEHVEEGKQINGEHYDVDGKLLIFFDNKLQVGDFIEIVYTSTGFQPDLHNTLFYNESLTRDNLNGKYYFRILGKQNKPLLFKFLNTTKKPRIKTRNGIMSLEYIHNSKDDLKNYDAPSWHPLHPKAYVTDLSSWKNFLVLNQLNFQQNKQNTSVVVQKVNTLINKNDEKAQQINTILNYVQKEIDYLEYDKIKPKQPEVVLKQGFGDCKSKSLLAIKMLETIDVEAWPVIVNSNGFDKRLIDFPSLPFDHCVLEFVHKKDTILFDATRHLQRGTIYDKYNLNYRYGFRVKDDTEKLTKLKHHFKNDTEVEVILHTRKNDNFFETFETTNVVYTGDLANQYTATYKKYGKKSITEYVNDDLLGDVWNTDSLISFSYKENEPKATIHISESSTRRGYFEKNYKNNTNHFIPNLLFNILHVSDKKSSLAVFSLPNFNITTQTYKIIHPKTGKIEEDSLVYKKDWVAFSKKVKHQNDTLIVSYTAEILKKELDSARYKEVRKDIDSIEKLSLIKINDTQMMVYQRENKVKASIIIYLIPLVFLVISVLIIIIIVKYLKKRKQLKRLQTEIILLKNKLEKYKPTNS